MKMKFTCSEAFSHYAALSLVLKNSNAEYPAAAIIHGSRNADRLKTELKEYIRFRDSKIEEFGEINENGVKAISTEKLNELMKKYDEVEIEVEINTVPVKEFMKYSYKAADLLPFEFMIVDKEE